MSVPAQPNPMTGPALQAAAEAQPVPATFQPQPPVPLPAYEQAAQTESGTPEPVRIPPGGYSQRFVTVPLPEFNQPGIDCQARLRNPGMMSQGTFESIFTSVDGIELDQNGDPKIDPKDAMPALYGQLLKLIAGWTMWDADSDDDVPPLLPSPPTSAEELKRAPAGALKRIMEAMQELQVPQ